MKIKNFLVVLLGIVLFSCGRDDDSIQEIVKQEEKVELKDFVLEVLEISIKKGEKGRIKIISGNGDYDYLQNLGFALINEVENNQYLEITGLAEGSRRTTITDIKSGKRIQIIIHITE